MSGKVVRRVYLAVVGNHRDEAQGVIRAALRSINIEPTFQDHASGTNIQGDLLSKKDPKPILFIYGRGSELDMARVANAATSSGVHTVVVWTDHNPACGNYSSQLIGAQICKKDLLTKKIRNLV